MFSNGPDPVFKTKSEPMVIAILCRKRQKVGIEHLPDVGMKPSATGIIQVVQASFPMMHQIEIYKPHFFGLQCIFFNKVL